MKNDNASTFFLRVNDEDLAKLLLFTKSRQKSKLFTQALIFYLLTIDERKIMEFASPALKNEFEKVLKILKRKYKDKSKKLEEKENKEIEKVKEKKIVEKKEITKDNEDFEEDEF